MLSISRFLVLGATSGFIENLVNRLPFLTNSNFELVDGLEVDAISHKHEIEPLVFLCTNNESQIEQTLKEYENTTYSFLLISNSHFRHPQILTYWCLKTLGPEQEDLFLLAWKLSKSLSQNKQQQNRLNSLAKMSSEGFYRCDCEGKLLEFDLNYAQILGYPTISALAEVNLNLGRDLYIIPGRRNLILKHLLEGSKTSNFESQIVQKDSSVLWISEKCKEFENEATGKIEIEGIVRDVSTQKEIEEQTFYDSVHDTLTDLPNRIFLLERLNQVLQIGSKDKVFSALVVTLDINDFQLTNDSMGRFVGDKALIAFADRMNENVHTADVFARLSGDKFSFLFFNGYQEKQTTSILEKIQSICEKIFEINGKKLKLSCSIGAKIINDFTIKAESILLDCDTALRDAKKMGRGRISIFDPKMQEKLKRRFHLEEELQRGIVDHEFEMYYQPILSLDENTITGFEALIRWDHPERGIVSPIEFIPIAEECNLIVPLGNWILNEVCLQTKKWVDMGYSNLVAAVNVSAIQFLKADMKQEVISALLSSGLDAKNLKLEVTESLAMENVEHTIETLTELTKMGVRISIDDFGTGYSSLGYLKKFPFHTLKIDRSFICELPANLDDSKITKMIVSMAQSLELEIVAEGVETVEQKAFLEKLNCNYYQGYLYSKPLPAPEFEKLLLKK